MSSTITIILFMFFVGFTNTVIAIRCYDCFETCSSPFNTTDPNVRIKHSFTGWCMKVTIPNYRISGIFRFPDTVGACSENECRSSLHRGFLAAGCCCNTDLLNGDTCQCCFSWQTEGCQVPSIYIPCEDCTSFFCANHVKGCQGTPPCKAECIHDSSSTTTKASSSYPPTETATTVTTSTTTTIVASAGYFIRSELFVIFASWTLLALCRLSL